MWTIYIPTAIAGMIGGGADHITHALAAIAAARLGPTHSAAFDLMLLLFLVVVQCLSAFCAGFTIPMAQYMGAGNSVRAFEVVKAAVVCAYCATFTLAFLLYQTIPWFALLATHDLELRKVMISTRAIGALMFASCVSCSLHVDILFNQGRGLVVMGFMTPVNWFIGIPLSFLLAPTYSNWGITAGLF